MNFIVVAYYTKNTLYEKEVANLIASLKKFSIPNNVIGIDTLGDWSKNTNYKPKFILQQMLEFPDKAIVYVDADAVFMQYPVLFSQLTCDIAVHVFDKKVYYKTPGIELLSGTLFFSNSYGSQKIVNEWAQQCDKNPRAWDQQNLQAVLKDYQVLPPEYCKIFDTMRHVKNPVIVHYQASRKVRRQHGCLV